MPGPTVPSRLPRAATLLLAAVFVLAALGGCSKARKESVSLTNRGVKAFQRHDSRVALDYFKRAAEADPSNEAAHYHLGLVLYHDLGDMEGARKSFQTAMGLDPKDIDAAYQLGRLDYDAGRPGDARKQLEMVLEREPEHAGAWYFMGKLAEDRGDLEQADAAYRKALTYDASHAAAFHSLGLLYESVGAREEAAQVFREAIRLNPDDAESHNTLGVMMLEQGRAEEAISLFYSVAELQPGRRDVLFSLGNSFLHAGDNTKAIYYLQRYVSGVEGAPDDPAPYVPVARIMIDNIQKKLGIVQGEPSAVVGH